MLKTAALALTSGIAWDKSGYLITACSPSVYLLSVPDFFTVLSPSLWVGNSPTCPMGWGGLVKGIVLFIPTKATSVLMAASLLSFIIYSHLKSLKVLSCELLLTQKVPLNLSLTHFLLSLSIYESRLI